MLKRLRLKKKKIANVSLLNRKYSYFVGNIYAIVKRNSFTKLSFSFVYLNIEMCGYFVTKKNSFTKLSFRFIST